MYTSFDSILHSIRKDEPNDYYNHVGAGFISGALYKSTGNLIFYNFIYNNNKSNNNNNNNNK